MKRFQTKGIVLKRVNYGEADRIITFLTPDLGKIGVMAKAVRKPKSKLAGGIELFSVSDLTVLEGKGELNLLISARTDKIFRHIVRDYDVVQVGYKALEITQKGTEDQVSKEYFELLVDTFSLLDGQKLSPIVIQGWFYLQFLSLQGHAPHLTHDQAGAKLDQDKTYRFEVNEGAFFEDAKGNFDADAIKAWRVLLTGNAQNISKVAGLKKALEPTFEQLQQFVVYVSN